MMQTYSLLGVAEYNAGRPAEARVWDERSRELAVQLKDQPSLAVAAQNIGIVCQEEGEAARERGDESGALRHFEDARRSVEESLRIRQALNDKPREAASRSQLARIHLRLGDLATAERHAHESRQIREPLGLKEAWKDYSTLSEIAQARGDTRAAAAWAKKRDDLLAEFKRRAGGGGGLPAQMLQALQQLTIACAQAGFGGDDLGPDVEEALAMLDQHPTPFPTSSPASATSPPANSPRSPPRSPPSCGKRWSPWPKQSANPAQVDQRRRKRDLSSGDGGVLPGMRASMKVAVPPRLLGL